MKIFREHFVVVVVETEKMFLLLIKREGDKAGIYLMMCVFKYIHVTSSQNAQT